MDATAVAGCVAGDRAVGGCRPGHAYHTHRGIDAAALAVGRVAGNGRTDELESATLEAVVVNTSARRAGEAVQNADVLQADCAS
jgi:hypothetical protein